MNATTTMTATALTPEERYFQAIDKAANYPMYGDGVTPPVAVGNIGHYADRVIINLACKTERCVGGPRAGEHRKPTANATLSQPDDWKLRFNTGDYVCALIEDGYVKKLLPVTAMQARQISYRPEVVAQSEAAMVASGLVDADTGEVLPAASAGDTVLKSHNAKVPALAAYESQDLPF